MVTADELSLLRLFEQAMPAHRLQELDGQDKNRGGQIQVFTLPVVVEMMLLQRLRAQGSQQDVVDALTMGGLDHLLADCKRVREERVSSNTGGYARACGRISLSVLERICDDSLAELGQRMEPEPELHRRVLLLDGTSLSVPHTSDLLHAYPPASNQFGEGHWGIMKVVALHDVQTGIALRPAWGAMYGKAAVSEQQLAAQAIAQSPAESVILGDSNFGTFEFAYTVAQSRRHSIFRLTKARAQAMGATRLLPTGETRFCWRPSRWERHHHPELPADAEIHGRLIAVTCNGFRDPWYLFTTLEDDWEKVVALYAKRWNLELDLRTLKHTLRMDRLRGRSKAAVEKELLIGVVAYGLVRCFMALAARRAGLNPRELSFTRAYGLLNAAAGKLCSADPAVRTKTLDRILDYIAKSKLPKRRKPRAYPRAIWGPAPSFPRRKAVRTDSE